MRVLVVHNSYQQKGGEDTVVESEVALLRSYGHEVELLLVSNHSIGTTSRAKLAVQTLWSQSSADGFKELARSFKPDVIHVHNTFPLISPALYWAAASMNLPVVQTLHNQNSIHGRSITLELFV